MNNSTNSRRAFLEKLFTGTVVAAAAPSVILGVIRPKVFAQNAKIQGQYIVQVSKFAQLANVGGSIKLTVALMPARIIVTRAEAQTFATVLDRCTHEGNALKAYSATAKLFTCTATDHSGGSQFDAFGVLKRGPALTNLTSYPTQFDGNDTVTITLPVAGVFSQDAGELSVQAYVGSSGMADVQLKLNKPAHVVAGLFDLNGREVVTVANGDMESGTHHLVADVRTLPAGSYLCRVQTSTGFASTVKLVVAR